MSDPSAMPTSNEAITAESLKVPRLYQEELLEEAKKRNIIIRADTGSGKTLVACELIMWMHQQPKPTVHHQIQVFLVPTRPLAHQQAEFIKSRSGLSVKAFSGDVQTELYKADKLRSELNQIDVLVSTPKIFYDLISKGYWKFEDVSLLIFDEAHHCRKDHIYNQIMRSQYHRLAQDPKQRLPKILGMTASPIWDYKNLQQAERDIRILQTSLAAQLYEVKNQVEDISKHNFKPNESMVYYEPAALFEPLTQPPWDRINQLVDVLGNDRLVSNFQSVYSELGIYAYKLLITSWLKSLVVLDNSKKLTSSQLLDPNLQTELKKIITQMDNSLKVDDVPKHLLSSKIITLNKILIDYLENDDQREFQCIVFVNRRLHAQLLPTLLECNATLKAFIRPVALAGHGTSQNDCISLNMDYKAQNNAVVRLKTGESNLVVATNVAEEGLDFRTCNLVIRFDEITSWKGYIQSRGRARARDSDYIVMLPTSSGPKFSDFIGKEQELQSLIYNRPENELIEEGEIESTPQLMCKLPNGNQSILTYNASTSLLNDVCQLVPSDKFLPSPLPDYEFQLFRGKYRCTVTLPPMAAVHPSQRMFKGEPMPTKKDAKRSAAFAACKLLRELGVLNEYFRPYREDKMPEAQDAHGRKIENVEIPEQVEAIIPNVYGNLWTSTEIWIHKLSFPDDSPTGYSTMGLLCERHLRIPDDLHLFNHFDSSKPLPIKFDETHQIKWDKDHTTSNLKKLEKFTRVVLQGAVNRKAYEGTLYFLIAPLLEESCEIDWSLAEKPLIELSSIEEFPQYPVILAPIRQLHSRIIDTYELCADLSETSEPSSIPICPKMSDFLKKIKKFKTLGHFFRVVYDLKDSQIEGQKLVYLEASFEATNNLAQSDSSSPETFKILLPLVVCKGTHLPRTYWKMYSYLPSLTRILHDGCQASALFEKLNITGTQVSLGIKALTPSGVGVPWDYQTLETVGDSFLKLATTIHIYLVNLSKGEGDMSHLRARSIDNAYLRRKAIQANLSAYILSQRFRIDTFRDAQTEDGKVIEGGFSRKIPRRVLSDVVEALLGASFLSGGVELGLKCGTTLDLCFGGTTPWGERELAMKFSRTWPAMLTPLVLSRCQQMEERINYVFKNKLLLVQAFTHRSANSFVTNCYEREEWLGDAVIEMWIVEHTYRGYSNATAEELTLARAKAGSNGSLGFLAIKKLGLQDTIIHNSETFKQQCKEAVETIKHFSTIGEYYSNIDNLFVVFDPPKILNDVFEAIIGAVFIDCGFNLESTYQTLNFIFAEVIPVLSRLVAHDPLSRLLEMRDKRQCTGLEREVTQVQTPNPEGENLPPISTRVCRISLHGQEVAVGQHPESISVAEQRAALEALKVLEENDSTMEGENISESFWSKCQCKSMAALLSSQRNLVATSSKLAGVAEDLVIDELVTSSCSTGKKNRKKRVKLAKIQAQVKASPQISNSVANDHDIDLGDDSMTNNQKDDDTIINQTDDSINYLNDDSINDQVDNSITNQWDDSINNQADDSNNNQKDNSINVQVDDSTNNQNDDLINDQADDSTMKNQKDDFINDQPGDSIKNQHDDSIIDQAHDSISNQKNDSMNHQADHSINNQNHDSMNDQADDCMKNQNHDSINHQADHCMKNHNDGFIPNQAEDSINNQVHDSINYQVDDSIKNQNNDSINHQVNDSMKNHNNDSMTDQAEDSINNQNHVSINHQVDDSIENHNNDSVTDQAEDSVHNQNHDSINNQAEDSVKSQNDDSINHQVNDTLKSQNDHFITDQAEDSIFNQTHDSINDQAQDSINNQNNDSIDNENNASIKNQNDDSINDQAQDSINNQDQIDDAIKNQNDDLIEDGPINHQDEPKSRNDENDEVIEIKVQTEGSAKMQPGEGIKTVEIIEILDDSAREPLQARPKLRKDEDDEIIEIAPSLQTEGSGKRQSDGPVEIIQIPDDSDRADTLAPKKRKMN